jgi:hypothetical protein
MVVSTILGQRNELSLLTGLAFFGLTLTGPFVSLGPLFWGLGPHAMEMSIAATIVCLSTFCYLMRPNNVSLAISLIGALAWVLFVPVLVVILPELQIRV